MEETRKKITRFTFFESYSKVVKFLNDKEAGILIKGLCAYVFEGKTPDFNNEKLEGYFELMKPNIDTSLRMSKIRPNAPNKNF